MIAEEVRSKRKQLGFTQVDLAVAAGVSPSTISLIERGDQHEPHRSTLVLIEQALGLESGHLKTKRSEPAVSASKKSHADGTTAAKRSPAGAHKGA